MYDVNDLPSLPVYEWDRAKKRAFLDAELSDLTDWHAARCPEYARMRDAWPAREEGFEALPFLPVRLFKELTLKSVPDEALHRTMTSSGTTGQQVSRIYLDRETSALQSKVLSRIMGEFLGKQRLPMMILDTSAVIKNRAMFSARGAGILGFSMFARDKVFALDEHMELDREGLEAFLKKHEGEDIFLFGFTFMICSTSWPGCGRRATIRISAAGCWCTAADGRSWRTSRFPPSASSGNCGRPAASPACTTTTAWSSRPAPSTWNASTATCTRPCGRT